MTAGLRRRAAALLAMVCLAIPLARPAQAAGTMEAVGDGLAIAYDVVLLRPLNAVALVLGAGFFAVSAPLVAPFGGRDGIATSWDVFIAAPYEYTVVRDLGDF